MCWRLWWFQRGWLSRSCYTQIKCRKFKFSPQMKKTYWHRSSDGNQFFPDQENKNLYKTYASLGTNISTKVHTSSVWSISAPDSRRVFSMSVESSVAACNKVHPFYNDNHSSHSIFWIVSKRGKRIEQDSTRWNGVHKPWTTARLVNKAWINAEGELTSHHSEGPRRMNTVCKQVLCARVIMKRKKIMKGFWFYTCCSQELSLLSRTWVESFYLNFEILAHDKIISVRTGCNAKLTSCFEDAISCFTSLTLSLRTALTRIFCWGESVGDGVCTT